MMGHTCWIFLTFFKCAFYFSSIFLFSLVALVIIDIFIVHLLIVWRYVASTKLAKTEQLFLVNEFLSLGQSDYYEHCCVNYQNQTIKSDVEDLVTHFEVEYKAVQVKCYCGKVQKNDSHDRKSTY